MWSFRRCPYAMRARLALQVAGVHAELREIVLRAKPAEFLEVSPDGTVPLLHAGQGIVAESLDIMLWALDRSDPEGWLAMPEEGRDLIRRFDGPFKQSLDRTKYVSRHPESDPEEMRAAAMGMLGGLAPRLDPWLFGRSPRLADMAILPFVRQFAMIDRPRFGREAPMPVQRWLETFLALPLFAAVMPKLPPWAPGQAPRLMPFPAP
nr:glutathione S-transferase [Mangrovicoccus sp. HB161399]